jgi:hypothetical protein
MPSVAFSFSFLTRATATRPAQQRSDPNGVALQSFYSSLNSDAAGRASKQKLMEENLSN